MNVKKKNRPILPEYFTEIHSEMHQAVIDGLDENGEINQHLSAKEKELIASVLALYYDCDLCHGYHQRALLRTLEAATLTDKTKTKISDNLHSLSLSLQIQMTRISRSESKHWIKLWKPLAKKIDRYFTPRSANLTGYAVALARNDESLMSYCMEQLAMGYTESEQSFEEMIGEIRALTAYMKSSITTNRTSSAVERDLGEVSQYFTES